MTDANPNAILLPDIIEQSVLCSVSAATACLSLSQIVLHRRWHSREAPIKWWFNRVFVLCGVLTLGVGLDPYSKLFWPDAVPGFLLLLSLCVMAWSVAAWIHVTTHVLHKQMTRMNAHTSTPAQQQTAATITSWVGRSLFVACGIITTAGPSLYGMGMWLHRQLYVAISVAVMIVLIWWSYFALSSFLEQFVRKNHAAALQQQQAAQLAAAQAQHARRASQAQQQQQQQQPQQQQPQVVAGRPSIIAGALFGGFVSPNHATGTGTGGNGTPNHGGTASPGGAVAVAGRKNSAGSNNHMVVSGHTTPGAIGGGSGAHFAFLGGSTAALSRPNSRPNSRPPSPGAGGGARRFSGQPPATTTMPISGGSNASPQPFHAEQPASPLPLTPHNHQANEEVALLSSPANRDGRRGSSNGTNVPASATNAATSPVAGVRRTSHGAVQYSPQNGGQQTTPQLQPLQTLLGAGGMSSLGLGPNATLTSSAPPGTATGSTGAAPTPAAAAGGGVFVVDTRVIENGLRHMRTYVTVVFVSVVVVTIVALLTILNAVSDPNGTPKPAQKIFIPSRPLIFVPSIAGMIVGVWFSWTSPRVIRNGGEGHSSDVTESAIAAAANAAVAAANNAPHGTAGGGGANALVVKRRASAYQLTAAKPGAHAHHYHHNHHHHHHHGPAPSAVHASSSPGGGHHHTTPHTRAPSTATNHSHGAINGVNASPATHASPQLVKRTSALNVQPVHVAAAGSSGGGGGGHNNNTSHSRHHHPQRPTVFAFGHSRHSGSNGGNDLAQAEHTVTITATATSTHHHTAGTAGTTAVGLTPFSGATTASNLLYTPGGQHLLSPSFVPSQPPALALTPTALGSSSAGSGNNNNAGVSPHGTTVSGSGVELGLPRSASVQLHAPRSSSPLVLLPRDSNGSNGSAGSGGGVGGPRDSAVLSLSTLGTASPHGVRPFRSSSSVGGAAPPVLTHLPPALHLSSAAGGAAGGSAPTTPSPITASTAAAMTPGSSTAAVMMMTGSSSQQPLLMPHPSTPSPAAAAAAIAMTVPLPVDGTMMAMMMTGAAAAPPNRPVPLRMVPPPPALVTSSPVLGASSAAAVMVASRMSASTAAASQNNSVLSPMRDSGAPLSNLPLSGVSTSTPTSHTGGFGGLDGAGGAGGGGGGAGAVRIESGTRGTGATSVPLISNVSPRTEGSSP